jgi:succinate dehydrogenase / fumarate reductase iron-sulfur subunit
MSFLEMLDVVNEQLTIDGKEPIAFDHDCREGICGHVRMCGRRPRPRRRKRHHACVNCTCAILTTATPSPSSPSAPWPSRSSRTLPWIAVPWTKSSRPAAMFRCQHRRCAGCQRHPGTPGSGRTGHGCRPVHRLRRLCGLLPQCVRHAVHQRENITAGAACPRANPKRPSEPSTWFAPWTTWDFGNCTNERECEAECPKEISITNIARLNREYFKAGLFSKSR